MILHVHNTQSGRKEAFQPLDPGHVRMYVCGPTVYDRAHIGNARPVVVFDVLYRLLRRLYPRVTYVRNITDVDDKINAAAKARGIPIAQVTAETTRYFHDDIAALNTLPPDVEPRATDHIPQMIAMIEALIAKGCAYAAEGHVLFSVATKPDYGKLSHRSREDMVEGARVEVAPYKKDPADFVLWKPSSNDLPGWPSPWGRGRPGWHLECSAMSQYYLGESFDIHGGGIDLVFPHHENEIAQSECACGKPFVRYWMHNGFLSVEGEKMSKSLGNFVIIRDALDRFPGEAIRLALLSTHYRKPADWTEAGAEGAKKIMDQLYRAVGDADVEVEAGGAGADEILAPLLDDLNTVEALRLLRKCADALAKARTAEAKRARKAELLAAGGALGLLQQEPETWFAWRPAAAALGEDEIERMIAAREAARKAKDFARADALRDDLVARGVVLEDKPGGTSWRWA